MQSFEARKARHLLADFRVVFHRARSQRIEMRVDGKIKLRQARVMADDVELAGFGKLRGEFAERVRGKHVRRINRRNIERGKRVAAPVRARFLKNRFHYKTSRRVLANWSMSAFDLVSVTHH